MSMFKNLAQYPLRQRQEILRWGGITVSGLIACAVLGIQLYRNAWPPYYVVPIILLIVMLILLPTIIFFAQISHTRTFVIADISEKKLCSDAPLTRQFMFDKQAGRALAKNYGFLVTLAHKHKLQPISQWGQANVYDKVITYYDPKIALESLRELTSIVKADYKDDSFRRLVRDMDEVCAILNELESINATFSFAISP